MAGVNQDSARRWLRRVFRNSYTHRGQLKRVKKWSVKIQFQGVRRTISLNSSLRADAAREAAKLHQSIVSEGWLDQPQRGMRIGMAENAAKLDVRYWEDRLIQRPYPHPAGSSSLSQWSVRISHQGVSSYFPLGSSERKAASANALTIYKSIMKEGWEAANKRFPREVTLGFQWVLNPVAWTYTTFHTQPTAGYKPVAAKVEPLLRVVIVEPDVGIRQALHRWIALHPGVDCMAKFASAEQAFERASRHPNEFWLLNRSLPQAQAREDLDRFKQVGASPTGAIYSIYEDSNQLFLGTPGGASTYLLKRTSPDNLLAPILTSPLSPPLSPVEVLFRVRNFFQLSLAFGSAGEATRALASLTPREQEILECLSKGYVDKEVASRLGISAWTVHGHVKNIFEKLKVHTRTEAVVRFLQK